MTPRRFLLLMTSLCALVAAGSAVSAKADDISYGKSVFPVDRDLAAKVRMRYGSETGDPARILSGNYLTVSPEAVSQRDLFSRPYYYSTFGQPYSSFYGSYYGSGPVPFGYGLGVSPYGSSYFEGYGYGAPFFGPYGYPYPYPYPYAYGGYRRPFYGRPGQRGHHGRFRW